MSDIEIGSVWYHKGQDTEIVVTGITDRIVFFDFKYANGEPDNAYHTIVGFRKHHKLLRGADMVNQPKHYNDESGVRCCDVTDFMMFNGGNCFKYLYRCGSKFDDIEDLKKAKWYAVRAYSTDGNETPNGLQWDQDVRAIARYREHGIYKAMTAIRSYSWLAAAAFIGNEIARLESE